MPRSPTTLDEQLSRASDLARDSLVLLKAIEAGERRPPAQAAGQDGARRRRAIGRLGVLERELLELAAGLPEAMTS